jgi:hypothetical protein
MSDSLPNPPSRKTLYIGGGVAVAALAAVIVLFVLPAEFGIDPLGTGKATGLIGLSGGGEMTELQRGALRTGVLTPSAAPIQTDRWTIELQPFEAVEFKYTLAEKAPLLFSWRATGPLHYDMHAHPFDGGEALTESYGVGDAKEMRGQYTAPFSGIHGWYWQNRSLNAVTLTLNAAGAFSASTVFDGAGEHKRAIAAED